MCVTGRQDTSVYFDDDSRSLPFRAIDVAVRPSLRAQISEARHVPNLGSPGR